MTRIFLLGFLTLALAPVAARAATIDLAFNIQPVVVCEPAIPETCVTPGYDTDLVLATYEQVGIRVTMLPVWTIDTLTMPRTDPAVTGETEASVNGTGALAAFRNYMTGLGTDANTAYIGATGPRLSLFGTPVQGLAWEGNPDLPFALFANNGAYASTLSAYSAAAIARLNAMVIAHEVAHILGAQHDTAPPAGTMTHLMETQAYYPAIGQIPLISDTNMALMRSSALLQPYMPDVATPAPVPLPASFPALAAGLVLLGFLMMTGRGTPRSRTAAA